MTVFLVSYDTESPACLDATRQIVAVHQHYGIPATFFITGVTLEANRSEYRALLDDPLFEVASHTYSHRPILDQPYCGQGVTGDDLRQEIMAGKTIIEDVFERPCRGLRTGCGYADGYVGASEVLNLVDQAGYEYVSSQLLGPQSTLPAPLENQPFTYDDDGFPKLWEIPSHGWHDNILKGKFPAQRMLLWPPRNPDWIPDHPVVDPQEEAVINQRIIKQACDEDFPFVSLLWHPWSLGESDAEMITITSVLEYVREIGIATLHHADFLDTILRA